MSREKQTRHFHAGRQRKTFDGVEYAEVAESNGKVFVNTNGEVMRQTVDGRLLTLKPHDNGHGYVTVTFDCFGDPSRKVYVHRLVYEVFVSEIPDGWDVDHVNDDRSDNRLDNLRAMRHYDNLTVKPSTVVNRLRASRESIKKAVAAQEKPVVGTSADGVERWFKSGQEASRVAGVNPASISMAIHGNRIKTAGGMMWRFASKKEACNV